ncbi:MAG: hypothetical protein ABI378_00005 [Chitinophagaceae bacterium]
MEEQLKKQIEELKAEIKSLDTALLRSQVAQDVAYELAKRARQYAEGLEKRTEWLESRNAELENPKGGHYDSMSWSARIVFCIRKMKRPLCLQEIIRELEIMDKQDEMKYLCDNHISVTVSTAKKDGRLQIFKIRGTRGGFYAVNEWVNEEGKLSDKMMWGLL